MFTYKVHCMKYIKYLFLVFISLLIVSETFAQGRKLYPGQTRTRVNSSIPISRKIAYPWTWSLGLGTVSYFGQLCATGDCFIGPFQDIQNFQINGSLKYRFTNRISAGGLIRYGRMSGSDLNSEASTGRPARAIVFRTDVIEFMAFGTFDIIPSISRFMGDKTDQYNRRNFIIPYLIGGVGMMYFNPHIKDPATGEYASTVELQTFQGKSYSNIVPFVHGGIGLRMKVSEFFDIGADLTYTMAFTNYLDDMSSEQFYTNDFADNGGAVKPNADWSVAQRLGAPGYYLMGDGNPQRDALLTGTAKRAQGISPFFDGYGVFNIHLDYTMANPVRFKGQKAHKHFQRGKGTRHHQFQRK